MSHISTEERLIYMANQIARNIAAGGQEAVAAATADHIAAFWDPRMKERIFAYEASGRSGLDPAAARAIERLRVQGPPSSRTPATEFNAVGEDGHSDAG